MSGGDPSQLLRQAATALVAQASPATICTVLQLLLEGNEPAMAPSSARPPRAAPAKAPATSWWLALRRRVRVTMQTRGMDAAALASELWLGPVMTLLQAALKPAMDRVVASGVAAVN